MITTIVPIIILKTYNENGNWIGPVDDLRHPLFALTWVHLQEPNWMEYLTHAEADNYQKQLINFREIALKNLAAQSPGLFSHSKYDGDEFVYGIMMQEDGLGSSRLLLLNEFAFEEMESVFPKGYTFALPERSVAMVIRKDASPENLNEFRKLVKNCYENGTIPMSPELFDADELLAI